MGMFRCVKCLVYGDAKAIKNSTCCPLPFLIENERCINMVPSGFRFKLGSKGSHGSHALRVTRGIIICNTCGSYRMFNLDNLALSCMPINEQFRVHGASQGKEDLDHLRNFALPKGVKEWPVKAIAERSFELTL